MSGRRILNAAGLPTEIVDSICCDCWTNGCGLDGCFGLLADGLEAINPIMESAADGIWLCGSPLAFPLVFFFDSGPETVPPGGGWQVPMMRTPLKNPVKCCFYTVCCPCGQWHLRRQLLNGDMSQYKLWQGYHDGPHCCARRCPGAPITIRAGTYGEEKCPNAFLCAEVLCLAGFWSVCCSFDVNRRMIKAERNLLDDPTEVRVRNCIGFFSELMSKCWCLGFCVSCCSCLVGCCAPDSSGAQELSGEGRRAGSACIRCARTCWRGIWSVKTVAIGCMSAQMDVEIRDGQPLLQKPEIQTMDRGLENELDNDEDTDVWWVKK